MIKKILYIFIPIFAVLLMSYNVQAYTITQNVDSVQTVNQPQVSFYDGTNWTSFQRGYLSFNNSSVGYYEMRLTKNDFTSVNSFKNNDYIILNGFFDANQLPYSGSGDFYVVGGFIGSDGRTVNCSIIDLQFGAVQEYIQGTTVFYRSDFQLTCQIRNANLVDNNLSINFRLRPDVFGASGTIFHLNVNAAIYATPSSDTQKEEEATQDAANDSATSGGNSASNSQTATSSLLSVITAGVGAITSASPTNCKINGNMGNLNVGNIDLCANPVPTFMALIGSIIAVLVVLPLVILLFNRFISIIRSFQR